MNLPAEFLALWRGLVSSYRSAKAAHRALIRAWRAGEEIHGYPARPLPYGFTGVPRGWTYRNLLQHVPKPVRMPAYRPAKLRFLRH